MHVTKRRKPTGKDDVLCDSNSMTFWKKQDCGDSKGISGCHGGGGGRVSTGTQDSGQ